MNILRKLFHHSWKRYLSAFLVGLAISALALKAKGFDLRLYYHEALTAAGAVLILIGLLIWTTHLGSMDSFTYVFKHFREAKEHWTLSEYREAQAAKRRGHGWDLMPYIWVGLIFLVVGALLGVGLQ